jgi:TnpA family transposase
LHEPVFAFIRTGTVTASLTMRQLASYPRQNGLAAALRELGRIEVVPENWTGC